MLYGGCLSGVAPFVLVVPFCFVNVPPVPSVTGCRKLRLRSPSSALCCAPPHRPRPRLLACIVTGPPNQRRGGLFFFNEALRLSGVNPLTWVPPRRSRLRLCAGERNRLVRLSRRPARAWPAPVRPVGCRPDAVLARPGSLLLVFVFGAVFPPSLAARPAPGPPLAGPWDAVQMRPWPGPVRSFWFSFWRCLFPFARRPARAWPAPGRPVGCRPDAAPARIRSLLLFCPSLKTINSRLRFLSAFENAY